MCSSATAQLYINSYIDKFSVSTTLQLYTPCCFLYITYIKNYLQKAEQIKFVSNIIHHFSICGMLHINISAVNHIHKSKCDPKEQFIETFSKS